MLGDRRAVLGLVAAGFQPLDWAIINAETAITAWLHVCAGRADNPGSFPGFGPDLSVEALSRRIVGNLLDAGWRIPGEPNNGS